MLKNADSCKRKEDRCVCPTQYKSMNMSSKSDPTEYACINWKEGRQIVLFGVPDI